MKHSVEKNKNNIYKGYRVINGNTKKINEEMENMDLSDWDVELDTEDYEDDFKDKKEKKTKQDILDAMYLDILDVLPKKLFVAHRTAEAPGKERMDIVLLTDHNKIIGNIHTNIKTGYDAFEEGNMEDRLLEGTIQDLQDWLKRHYSKVK